jgi:hypothetical protein
METTKNIYYLYVFTDTTKPGRYKYNEFEFDYMPFYVGVSNSNSYYRREDVHIKYAKIKKDVTNNKYKMNIINKIIKNKMEPKIYNFFENSTKEFIFEKEKELISLFGNRFDGSGTLVNISKGGEGGDTFSNNPRKEEIREKHRINATGENNNMYGLPLEVRPSHIAKLKGCHWNKGRVISEETRNLFKKINKGSGNPRSKKTLLFDKDFNLVKEFDYCSGISEYLDISNKAVSKTARTNSKKDIPYHTTKGYFIIYKDDWDNKFKQKESEILEFLKTFRKNKNQFS